MKYIAVRYDLDEPVIAVMECSEAYSNAEFVSRVRSAVKAWEAVDEDAQEAIENCGYDFNFGDLSLNSEDPGLLECLSDNGITNFKISVESTIKELIDFDTVLC